MVHLTQCSHYASKHCKDTVQEAQCKNSFSAKQICGNKFEDNHTCFDLEGILNCLMCFPSPEAETRKREPLLKQRKGAVAFFT